MFNVCKEQQFQRNKTLFDSWVVQLYGDLVIQLVIGKLVTAAWLALLVRYQSIMREAWVRFPVEPTLWVLK